LGGWTLNSGTGAEEVLLFRSGNAMGSPRPMMLTTEFLSIRDTAVGINEWTKRRRKTNEVRPAQSVLTPTLINSSHFEMGRESEATSHSICNFHFLPRKQ